MNTQTNEQTNNYMLPESVKKIVRLEYKTLPVALCFKSRGTNIQLSCKLKKV